MVFLVYGRWALGLLQNPQPRSSQEGEYHVANDTMNPRTQPTGMQKDQPEGGTMWLVVLSTLAPTRDAKHFAKGHISFGL